jgi:hypothetical protein
LLNPSNLSLMAKAKFSQPNIYYVVNKIYHLFIHLIWVIGVRQVNTSQFTTYYWLCLHGTRKFFPPACFHRLLLVMLIFLVPILSVGKQKTIVWSSTESEYNAMANGVSELACDSILVRWANIMLW